MAKDTSDVTAVAYVRSADAKADTDDVIGRADVEASALAQGGAGAAGGVASERVLTGGRVAVAGGVANQSLLAGCRIEATRSVVEESRRSVGRVLMAGDVANERH